ncbi:MAG: hypothetical protein OD811_05155 [Alphaproteobacteria bacterium]
MQFGSAVLIIRFGLSLGDLALLMPGVQKLGEKHKGDKIILLTRGGGRANVEDYFRPFIRVDECIIDPRPRLTSFAGLREFWCFIGRLRAYRFSHIYDLQGSDRTALYRLFLSKQPRHRARPNLPVMLLGRVLWWRHGRFRRKFIRGKRSGHMRSVWRGFWREYGIEAGADVDIASIPPLADEIANALSEGEFALVVPGGQIEDKRDQLPWPPPNIKRWPAHYFGEIARRLEAEGIRPLIIGTEEDRHALEEIRAVCPQAIDLLGKTGPSDLIHLGHRARLMVSGDTGPAHWATMGGVSVVSLFGSTISPEAWAPRNAIVIECRPLALLDTERVWVACRRGLEGVALVGAGGEPPRA